MFIGTLIVMVNVIIKLRQNQNLWVDFYDLYLNHSLGFHFTLTGIVGLPFVLCFFLYLTNLSRLSRFLLGLLFPFCPAYLVRVIFY